ncbi:RteC domain-containing protein [Sphingobacterium yanglingense]|uniref:RteC protein n=1 Tax=Sphingobacterium yanglingense TaxID=1437280 RepID=A0A4R6W530_9SPHI|nr:RteC domain-containing protein [Sphingobacterium yanglingense]TDQ73817.1 RteC protein [Sphingobacterium yanglingense]
MKQYCDTLHNKMLNELNVVQSKSENELQRYCWSYNVIEENLKDLKSFILHYDFNDIEEEISFFKVYKPQFQRELMYYQGLYFFEANMPIAKEGMLHYHMHTLYTYANFFEHHRALYNYYKMNYTENDHIYFTRSLSLIPNHPEYSLDLDLRFSTVFSYKLAMIQAYELLRDHVTLSLNMVENGEYFIRPNKMENINLKWSDKKSALIELLLAVHSNKSINNGHISFAKLVENFEKLFEVDLGNVYRSVQSMRIRKKDRTPYLHSLIKSLENYMDEVDIQ